MHTQASAADPNPNPTIRITLLRMGLEIIRRHWFASFDNPNPKPNPIPIPNPNPKPIAKPDALALISF